MELVINSVPLTVNGADDHPDWLDHIRRTLALIPAAHIRAIHHITVRDRRDYTGGSTNWVDRHDHAAGTWVMLDVDSFPKALNNQTPDRLHYTLLHETGHVIGTAYNCLSYLRSHRRSDESVRRGYAAMIAHPHEGRTSGAGEHFADTYADFFFHTVSDMATDDRMTALLTTPAFTSITPTPARRP
jgi:hypothetical protein